MRPRAVGAWRARRREPSRTGTGRAEGTALHKGAGLCRPPALKPTPSAPGRAVPEAPECARARTFSTARARPGELLRTAQAQAQAQAQAHAGRRASPDGAGARGLERRGSERSILAWVLSLGALARQARGPGPCPRRSCPAPSPPPRVEWPAIGEKRRSPPQGHASQLSLGVLSWILFLPSNPLHWLSSAPTDLLPSLCW
ncbi:gem-associated protein 7 isoform X1 [Phascolarctos cinereus]